MDSQIPSKAMAEMGSNINLQDRNNEIQIDLENTYNKENGIILSIELEERKLALLECQVKLKKEKTEAEAIELQNQQLKISLGLTL